MKGATVVLPKEAPMGSTETIDQIEAHADRMVEALADVLTAQTAVIVAAPLEVKRAVAQRNAAMVRASVAGCSIRQIAAKAVLSPGTVQRIIARSRG